MIGRERARLYEKEEWPESEPLLSSMSLWLIRGPSSLPPPANMIRTTF